MAALAQGVIVDHIARQSKDIRRLADFYIETFGFEEVESPKVGPLKVIWLVKPSAFTMHLIEFNPSYPPNESNDTAAVAEPAKIPRGHHICFSVSNFESFVQKLKEKVIETARRPVEYNPTGSKKIDQVFFFDPDGNGLEVSDSTAAKWVAPNRNAD
ncbi:PREDICTED: uncharacterized protein LOC101306749 [Fragaria vesca subsp. vesca]|uniref:uncharacterized protein LOC101306749 n=1 Tax=Fragaria vesca subsp. vesca TaxID=101020 RepID=UPI0002C300E1|nr:PREDICTED: uncharacterized protein LOC101306749 [Fragaria vesca subsp. vesca]